RDQRGERPAETRRLKHGGHPAPLGQAVESGRLERAQEQTGQHPGHQQSDQEQRERAEQTRQERAEGLPSLFENRRGKRRHDPPAGGLKSSPRPSSTALATAPTRTSGSRTA